MNTAAYNWNTYSGIGFNRLLKLPEKYELRISAFLPSRGLYTSKFYFSGEEETDVGQVKHILHHSPFGEYVKQQFSFHGYDFELTFSSFAEGELACTCLPLATGPESLKLLLEVKKIWGEGSLGLSKDGVISLPLSDGETLRIGACQERDLEGLGLYNEDAVLAEELCQDRVLNGRSGSGSLAALLFDGSQPLLITATRGGELDFTRVEEVLREKARNHGQDVVSRGLFSGSWEALNTAANSQIVYDDIHSCFYTPVTRRWVDFYLVKLGLDPEARGPVLGLWDCLFHSLLHSCQNQEAAAGNLKVVLNDDVITEGGYPPNYVAHPIKSGDRSQPPLGSLMAWKVYRKNSYRELLAYLYPYLLRWHRWWPGGRDGNGDGLLSWGSDDKTAATGNDAGTLFGAKCESGLDNSPLFDDAVLDEETKVMNLNSVFLSSLFAADCLYLAKIAAELGKEEDSRSLIEEYEAMKVKINSELWSEEKGIYLDRYWDGSFSHRIAPPSFFPLLARIPSREQAERMIEGYLLNEDHFWGEHIFPSISKADPAFTDQLYWRGRIWPPFNYLIYAGLKEYGFDDIAAQVAHKCYQLFMPEWRDAGHCHENYNALTGQGCDVPGKQENFEQGYMGNAGSDPFYTWGALLLLPAVEELIDVDPEGGLRFGSPYLAEESSLRRIPLADSSYSVTASAEQLQVEKDDQLLLSAVPGIVVRRLRMENNSFSSLIKGRGPTEVKLGGFNPHAAIRLFIDGEATGELTCDGSGQLTVKLDLEGSYRKFRMETI